MPFVRCLSASLEPTGAVLGGLHVSRHYDRLWYLLTEFVLIRFKPVSSGLPAHVYDQLSRSLEDRKGALVSKEVPPVVNVSGFQIIQTFLHDHSNHYVGLNDVSLRLGGGPRGNQIQYFKSPQFTFQ